MGRVMRKGGRALMGALAVVAFAVAGDARGAVLPPVPPLPGRYCRALVLRDYALAVAYYAVVTPAPECRADQVARVRKVSTLNYGARYTPIRPPVGAWEIAASKSTLPADAHWTLFSWRWQWWNGADWVFAVVR